MIGVKSHLEKAEGAVARNEAAFARVRQMFEKHGGERPDGSDADALYLWRRELRDIEDRRASADEALTFSRQALETARADEQNREQRRKHAAMLRRGQASKKRVAGIIDLIDDKLNAELAWLAEEVAEFDAYNQNERPRDLPFVPDAEYLLRYRAPVDIPAKYEDIEVWVDCQGRQATQFKQVGGEMVPAGFEAHYKKKERVCTQTPRHEPGHMPPRLANLLGELGKYKK